MLKIIFISLLFSLQIITVHIPCMHVHNSPLLTINQGWGSGFDQKPDPGLWHFKRRKIFKSLLNENFRLFFKAFFLFSYIWCQKSPVSPRAPVPGWFSESRTWYVWHQKYKNKKDGFINYLKYYFNRLLKIYLRLRYRAPDPVFLPKLDPHPCHQLN